MSFESMPEKPKGLHSELFDAYLEGNLRFPQTYIGIAVLLADAILKKREFSFEKLMQDDPSPEQIARVREAMNRAHAARLIPVGTEGQAQSVHEELVAAQGAEAGALMPPHVVPNSRLEYLLFTVRTGMIQLIAKLAQFKEQPPPEELAEKEAWVAYARALDERLATDSALAFSVRDTISKLRQALDVPEIAAQAATAREAVSFHRKAPTSHDEYESRLGWLNTAYGALHETLLNAYDQLGGTQGDELRVLLGVEKKTA